MGRIVWLRGLGYGLASVGFLALAALALVVIVPSGNLGLGVAAGVAALALAWSAAHDAMHR